LGEFAFEDVFDLFVEVFAELFFDNAIDVFAAKRAHVEEEVGKCGELELGCHVKEVASGSLSADDSVDEVDPKSFEGEFVGCSWPGWFSVFAKQGFAFFVDTKCAAVDFESFVDPAHFAYELEEVFDHFADGGKVAADFVLCKAKALS